MKIYDYHGKNNICGTRIKEARKEMHLSQMELAELLERNGISIDNDSISRIELGARFITDYEILTFAKVFDKKIDWFYS